MNDFISFVQPRKWARVPTRTPSVHAWSVSIELFIQIVMWHLASDLFWWIKKNKQTNHPQKDFNLGCSDCSSLNCPPHILPLPYPTSFPTPPKTQPYTHWTSNATLTHHILASTSHPPPPPPPPPQMATKLAYILTPPRLLITSHFRIKPFLPLSSTSSSSSSASFPGVYSMPLVGRQFSFRRRLFILSPKATTDQPG